MSNAGYPETRVAVAAYLSQDQGVDLTGAHIVMTVGAGGALNVILKAILDPGDEVIVPVPYFVEYGSYVDNHGGVLRPVGSTTDFDLDLASIEAAIGPQTKAVLINSPHNPTGRVYSAETLAGLGALLRRKSEERGCIVYLVSDEPYRRIVYDGLKVPAVMAAYENSLIASSYSKELSLSGERIGYAAANPAIPNVGAMVEALTMTNRILGYVNAPALMQRVVAKLQGVSVDISPYQRNRDVLYQALIEAGFEVYKPQGAFYMFPKAPVEDDVAFCREMQEHLVLVVPGSGFGAPGYFRMAYCVAPQVVDGAIPALKQVGAKYFKK
jgi:aspartate aminotransferase